MTAHDFRWTYLGKRCVTCWTWEADATAAPCPGRKGGAVGRVLHPVSEVR